MRYTNPLIDIDIDIDIDIVCV